MIDRCTALWYIYCNIFGSCDTLIADYSPIYYDYTLCDKPIALIREDYKEYKNSVGFADGCEEFLNGGEKIYTLKKCRNL